MPDAAANDAPADPLPDDPSAVDLVLYPDPRLRRHSRPVRPLDGPALAKLRILADRMFDLMREHKGVGLAAPQVGLNLRLFVMNPTGEPADARVYLNPVLSDADADEEEAEEGCLSLPEIRTLVPRSLRLRMRAVGLDGTEIDETAEGFVPRVWQHEVDHLDGVLILDKMPPTARMASRKKLRELQENWKKAHPEAAPPAKKKRRFGRRR